MRAAVGQRRGRMVADSGVGAGDHGDAPGLIRYVGGGPSAMGVHGRQPYSPPRSLRGVVAGPIEDRLGAVAEAIPRSDERYLARLAYHFNS